MSGRDPSYVQDMLNYAHRVSAFMDGVDRDRLEQDLMLQDAVIRALSVIGEAARRVSDEYRAAHPEVPWRGIVGMRHVLVHDYTDVDLDAVWSAASHEVPALVPALETLLEAADTSAD